MNKMGKIQGLGEVLDTNSWSKCAIAFAKVQAKEESLQIRFNPQFKKQKKHELL